MSAKQSVHKTKQVQSASKPHQKPLPQKKKQHPITKKEIALEDKMDIQVFENEGGPTRG